MHHDDGRFGRYIYSLSRAALVVICGNDCQRYIIRDILKNIAVMTGNMRRVEKRSSDLSICPILYHPHPNLNPFHVSILSTTQAWLPALCTPALETPVLGLMACMRLPGKGKPLWVLFMWLVSLSFLVKPFSPPNGQPMTWQGNR